MVHPLIAFAFNCIRAFAGILATHPVTQRQKNAYPSWERLQWLQQDASNTPKWNKWHRWECNRFKILRMIELGGPLSVTETKIRTVTIQADTHARRDQLLPALKQADQCAKCKLCSVAPILQLAPALTIVPRTWSPLGWQPSIDPSFILTFGQHRCSMCEWLATCVQHERCSAYFSLIDFFLGDTLSITHMTQASVSQKKCNNII